MWSVFGLSWRGVCVWLVHCVGKAALIRVSRRRKSGPNSGLYSSTFELETNWLASASIQPSKVALGFPWTKKLCHEVAGAPVGWVASNLFMCPFNCCRAHQCLSTPGPSPTSPMATPQCWQTSWPWSWSDGTALSVSSQTDTLLVVIRCWVPWRWKASLPSQTTTRSLILPQMFSPF